MPETIETSATITASGEFVHSGVGPASNSFHVSSTGSLAWDEESGGVTFPAAGQQWPLGTADIAIINSGSSSDPEIHLSLWLFED